MTDKNIFNNLATRNFVCDS